MSALPGFDVAFAAVVICAETSSRRTVKRSSLLQCVDLGDTSSGRYCGNSIRHLE